MSLISVYERTSASDVVFWTLFGIAGSEDFVNSETDVIDGT
jgi:hypothetical protein